MEISKARREGNAIVITIPLTSGVAEGEEFYMQRSDNGTILLVPKIHDYFAGAKNSEFREPLEWGDIYTPQGREEVE